MRHSIRIPAMIFLIIPMFLSSCQADRSATEVVSPAVEEPTQASPTVAESQEESTIETTTPGVEPSLEVVPTPREGLEATDPSTVVLASGKPTLVEFFAFW